MPQSTLPQRTHPPSEGRQGRQRNFGILQERQEYDGTLGALGFLETLN